MKIIRLVKGEKQTQLDIQVGSTDWDLRLGRRISLSRSKEMEGVRIEWTPDVAYQVSKLMGTEDDLPRWLKTRYKLGGFTRISIPGREAWQAVTFMF